MTLQAGVRLMMAASSVLRNARQIMKSIAAGNGFDRVHKSVRACYLHSTFVISVSTALVSENLVLYWSCTHCTGGKSS